MVAKPVPNSSHPASNELFSVKRAVSSTEIDQHRYNRACKIAPEATLKNIFNCYRMVSYDMKALQRCIDALPESGDYSIGMLWWLPSHPINSHWFGTAF